MRSWADNCVAAGKGSPVSQPNHRRIGMIAALLTPVFMGTMPIFGKLALRAGVDAYTLVVLRSCLAALLLWIVYRLFWRKYIFIFPAGLIGTAVVGAVNGAGSVLYYNGLLLLDNASLAQLLMLTYVIFAMLLTRIYGQHISATSVLRAALALAAVYLLSVGSASGGTVRWVGVGLVIGAAFLYALHIVLSQRVMFEMPAPTMTLYALTFMGATVMVIRLIVGRFTPLAWTPAQAVGWWPVAALMLFTALSRLTLFAGVRNLGSLQAVLLNMAETGVTLLAAFVWLGERMAPIQWVGVTVLAFSVLLSRWDSEVSDMVYRPLPHPSPLGGLLRPDAPPASGALSAALRLFRREPRAPQPYRREGPSS